MASSRGLSRVAHFGVALERRRASMVVVALLCHILIDLLVGESSSAVRYQPSGTSRRPVCRLRCYRAGNTDSAGSDFARWRKLRELVAGRLKSLRPSWGILRLWFSRQQPAPGQTKAGCSSSRGTRIRAL